MGCENAKNTWEYAEDTQTIREQYVGKTQEMRRENAWKIHKNTQERAGNTRGIRREYAQNRQEIHDNTQGIRQKCTGLLSIERRVCSAIY